MKAIKDGKYFKVSEFVCKGSGENLIEQELIDKLDKLREEFGQAIRVTSGYRSPEHNARIGGHPNSTHIRGIAADITGKALDKLYELCCKHFMSVGDGRKRGFVHCDLRSDRRRRWDY